MKIAVRDVIEEIIAPVGRLANTVDQLIFGSYDQEVTGIVVTFIPTVKVLQEAIDRGANLIITHENVFYHHHNAEKYHDTKIYQEKLKLIEQYELAIFRCHDYIHRYKPDGITKGLVKALNWGSYVREHLPIASIVEIPGKSLREIAVYVKKELKIDFLRYMGDLDMICSKVGIFVGYRGVGDNVIPLSERYNLELIICGEGPEWETPEFIRDSIQLGGNKAILILGHLESEQPGMQFFAQRLQDSFKEIPVYFIPENGCFQII